MGHEIYSPARDMGHFLVHSKNCGAAAVLVGHEILLTHDVPSYALKSSKPTPRLDSCHKS
ncbi:uncharacterized protein PpBr36_09772 [Pyricularia pennisetigena]|uniref:uncharacterized protein n=1 Tax=Pyricularia pennisetigena TaxID=1578925 RepID=UPI0011530646|nr:uncharacterized protein PpBr36_09772 [Pyricularia pennisetigena]TLS22246.1 hypothetical protein PpBr36_09772 [Pyricularia pennisetigena]